MTLSQLIVKNISFIIYELMNSKSNRGKNVKGLKDKGLVKRGRRWRGVEGGTERVSTERGR